MIKPMPVAILAGGLASRLRPVTEQVPKSLLEVGGRPFLARQLEWLRGQGLERVVLCVGYMGAQIEAAFGDGAGCGLRLEYSYDGPRLLGTGGAVRRALARLGPEFFVMYGDSYLPIPFAPVAEAFARAGRPALMTVYANDGRYDRSNVWLEGGEIKRYDKRARLPQMRHIDFGLCAFRDSVFANLPPDTAVDLADILRDLAARNQLAGYEVRERFYEIGSPAGLAELDQLFRAGALPPSAIPH